MDAFVRAFGSTLLIIISALGMASDSPTPAARQALMGNETTDTVVTVEGSDSLRIRVETVAAGLTVPWDMAFLPDGRILVTERPGRIRIIEDGVLRREPWATLNVFGEDPFLLPESGLMGIAPSPDYAHTGHVFVMATVLKSREGRFASFLERVVRRLRHALGLTVKSFYESRIYRFTDADGRGINRVTVMSSLPANYYHAGGALRFGPDEMLYFTLGDVLESRKAQKPVFQVGAILRIRRDGSIPEDNPLPGSAVYAYGLRNSQGLVWDSSTDAMLAIDHGPSFLPHEGGRYGHDELNVIVPGGNFGWPAEAGHVPDPRFLPPLVDWMPAIAPGGLAIYEGSLFTDWTGSLLVGGLRGMQMRRLVLDMSGESISVTHDEVVLRGLGRIRAVHAGPDDAIYITTSNQDGRGEPRPQGDRLLRLTPAP